MSPGYPYRRILVPVDFSEVSVGAVRHALALARPGGASVVLLSVVDTSFPYPDLYSFEDPNHDYFKVMRERALGRMKEWLEELREEAEGVAVEKLVARGRPAVEIPALAREVGADLLVVARHGAGPLRHAVMGSVVEAVVRSAPCPVLVLPPADPGPGDE
jgi:nucleotide-binding universal stress UspA family protein